MPFADGAAGKVSMDPLELEILQRFDESRNAYNKATGLLKNGRPDAAEALLRQALALYPREIFMNQDLVIDKSVLESYDLLFTNIRERLQMIERDNELPPRLDPKAVKSLQDLIERNLGEASPPPRRPGMKTQAAGIRPAGVPIPPSATGRGRESAVLNLDLTPDMMSHDQIVRELEVAVRAAHPFKAPAQGDPGILEEGEVDEFDIDITGQGDTHPDPNRDTEDFENDDIYAEPEAPRKRADTSVLDAAMAAEIQFQGNEVQDLATEAGVSGTAAADLAPQSDTILEDAGVDEALDAADFDAMLAGADVTQAPEHGDARNDTVMETGELAADDLEALVLEQEPAAVPEPVEPPAPDLSATHAPAPGDKPPEAFDDLTPIYKDENPATPSMPEVRESEIRQPAMHARDFLEAYEAPPLPEPILNTAPEILDMEAPAPMETEADDAETAVADEQPGRGLMGFFDKFINVFKRKKKDAFDQVLAGEEPEPAGDQPAAGEERMDTAVMASVEAGESVAPEPAPVLPQQPGKHAEAEHGEEEALEDESVVAEMVKIEKPREHKVHIQVYDGGRTARLLANVLVLALFGIGLLAAYVLVKPSVQLSKAYEAAAMDAPAKTAGLSGRVSGMIWGMEMAAVESDQPRLAALDTAARTVPGTPAGQGLMRAAVAAAMADSIQNKQPDMAARIGRWARTKGYSDAVVADLEFRSLTAAAEQAISQKEYEAAKRYIQTLDTLLEAPEFPTPGLRGFAMSEARRVEFLARAHAAAAALAKGRAEQAFGEIEPMLNSDQAAAPGVSKAFAQLKIGIRDALLEQARKARDEQGDAAAAQILMDKAGLLGAE